MEVPESIAKDDAIKRLLASDRIAADYSPPELAFRPPDADLTD